MTRLDHNRALSQLANKTGAPVSEIHRLTIWGNHSATQYPDIVTRPDRRQAGRAPRSTTTPGSPTTFIPTVAKRGAAIIEARGASSAASAANAAIDHVFSWVNGTEDGDWTSAAIVSDGSYGVPEGLISSFPVTSSGGDWRDRAGPRRSTTSRGPASTPRSPSSSRSATPSSGLGLV